MTVKRGKGKPARLGPAPRLDLSGAKLRPVGHGHGHSHGHGEEHSHGHGHGHGHGGEREHGHGRARSQEHGHDPRAVEERRPEIERGEGKGKILFLDANSGIAGDMSIAALVDLGVPFAEVEAAIRTLGLDGFALELWAAHAGAIGVARFDVRIDPGHPERTYSEIDALIAGAPLADGVKDLARRIFRRLGEAEARVHRIPLQAVHFHEVGAVDAIADIVGAAAAFCYLEARVVCAPLPMGHGFVDCRHGRIPLPAPATVECLRGVPTYDAGVEVELVTPTGAAIVATVAEAFEAWPAIVPERIGWGGGSKSLPDRPNALRAVLGSRAPHGEVASASHVVLETNVDDMTGEVVAHAIEALLAGGALDAWATPITMKKGRPALTISALVEAAQADHLTRVMLTETTTLGVRRYGVNRTERPRRSIVVQTPYGSVPLKVAEGPFGAPQVKPEFDVCAELAKRASVPVRVVIAAALAAYARDPGSVGAFEPES